jgi:hypothetical protein
MDPKPKSASDEQVIAAWRRRRLLLGIILGTIGAIVLLPVAGLWYISTEHFVRAYIVPRVEKSLERKVEFARIQLRPFRGVEIANLPIGPKPHEAHPLLTADRLHVEWKLLSLLRPPYLFAQSTTLDFRADSFHVDYFLDLFRGVPNKPAQPAQREPRVEGARAGADAFELPGPPVIGTFRIGRFYWDRYAAENVEARVRTTRGGFTVDRLQLKLADGVASGSGWLRTTPRIAYSGAAGLQNVSVARFLEMIRPGLGRKLTGRGQAHVRMSGAGFDGPAFRNSLQGDGSFLIADGIWQEMPVLHALREVTRIDAFESIPFSGLRARWRVGNQAVEIDDMMVYSLLQKLRMSGVVGFNEQINLHFDLWLAGDLVDQLKKVNPLTNFLVAEADRYLRLPVPVAMHGTLSNPAPALNLPIENLVRKGAQVPGTVGRVLEKGVELGTGGAVETSGTVQAVGKGANAAGTAVGKGAGAVGGAVKEGAEIGKDAAREGAGAVKKAIEKGREYLP